MRYKKRGQATILLSLFALSMISISFSAWVLGENKQADVNINVNVGPTNSLNDYVRVLKTKQIKFCKDGFVDDKGEVDFTKANFSVEFQIDAFGIRSSYGDPTKTDFNISTIFYENADNKLAYNLINDKFTYSLSGSYDFSNYQVLNATKPTIIDGVARTVNVNLDKLFQQNTFYLKLDYYIDIYDFIYDKELGFDYNKFEQNFNNTADKSKDLSRAKYDIDLIFGARS